MTDIKQNIVNIKREIAKSQPSKKQINDFLKDIQLEANSDTDYYDIVGEIFSFNPRYYMTSLYPKFKSLEMTRYLVEKFSLYENERIIYEFPGKIKQSIFTGINPVVIRVKGGVIYVTNLRIIAQGKLTVGGGLRASQSTLGKAISLQMAKKAQDKAKKGFLNESLFQELPCYGYQIKGRNHFELKKKNKAVKYLALSNIHYGTRSRTFYEIKITPPKSQVGELYELLRKDVEHVVEVFQEVNKYRRVSSRDLNRLWKSEEYQGFSDADYVDIAIRVYELNPEHFMASIYPKMQKWKFPSFLRIKDVLFEKLSQKESEDTSALS